MDKETAQNIITTGMNTLGMKAKGGTIETAGKATEAFQNAPSIPQGLAQAGKIVGGEVVSNAYNTAKMPVDIAK